MKLKISLEITKPQSQSKKKVELFLENDFFSLGIISL